MAATGSTQRYKRQLDQLEHSLTAKLQELSILEQENEVLKQNERALSSFISSVEGGVAVTAHILKQQTNSGATAAAAAAGSSPTVSGSSSAAAATATAAAGEFDLGGVEMLERIEAKEREIQQVLQQLEAGPYDNLYSSQLLRAASNNPDLTAQILATQPKQRRQNWYSKVQQIALLLPKYDYPELGNFAIAAAAASDTAASSSSSAQEVVDGLVDDLVTGLLVTGLLDPPQMMLYNFMVNMSTHTVVDNYPEAFWQHVAQGLKLTDKQRSALHISWKRVKAEKLALTAQHEAVLARLNHLRAQLRQQSRQFEQQTHQVMQQPPDPHDEIVQRRQQQQQFFAQRQQQQLRQQQQQQGIGVQGDSEDPALIFNQILDDDFGESEIQDLLRDMNDHHDQHQQWLLLQELDQQQQQQLDGVFPNCQQHDGLASSDVVTLAVSALTVDVANGLEADGMQPDSTGASNPQQQQQQQQQGLQNGSLPAPATPAAQPPAAASVSPRQQQQQADSLVKPELGQGHSEQQQKQSLPGSQQQQQQDEQQEAGALLDWQAIVTQLQEIQQHVGACTEQHEHFVPVGSKEQQQLERELNRIRGKIKMQHYCSALFWVNTLSKKQLATLYVLSWPFMPDGFALSEELEAERSPSTSTATIRSG